MHCRASECTKKPYCRGRKSTTNWSKMEAKSTPNLPRINQNWAKVIPQRSPDPISEKNVFSSPKCTPKWDQSGAQMVPKLMQNRVRKRVDFWDCFFIVSGWFLGGKSGRKSSKIGLRRRSGTKTWISRKCWFYYSKTIIFEVRDVLKCVNFGEESDSGASRSAGSKKHSEKVRFSSNSMCCARTAALQGEKEKPKWNPTRVSCSN